MPRPELELIPVHYRRIPILAIGRDIYLDTRLQLRALEALPGVTTPRLGATNPSDLFVEKLLEKLINEGPVFAAAAGMVPMEIAQNEQFNKDRQGLFGNQWTKEEIEENLGGSANYIKNLFAFLEETALKDGREWILTGDGPKMADIEGEWATSFSPVACVERSVVLHRARDASRASQFRHGMSIVSLLPTRVTDRRPDSPGGGMIVIHYKHMPVPLGSCRESGAVVLLLHTNALEYVACFVH